MREEWTEKYRPKTLGDIVGNEVALRKIRRWAESWKAGAPRVRTLVLQGEPGTGKTSAALALANDMGWDHIEMNASDQRNAASIESVAGAGSANQTFAANGEFLSSSVGKRKLVILDEADNLFGNQDRGGAKAIVETIKNTAQPIILIVNDYEELKRKAPAVDKLAEKAVFTRLSKADVTKVMRAVLGNEGVSSQPEVLDKIAENVGGDLRAAINDLQMMVEGRLGLELEHSFVLGKRNQEKEIRTALHSVFHARSLREARDATFDLDSDPEDLVLWIEESIPVEMSTPGEMAAAFDAVSKADIYLRRTRALQHYGLWAYAKELMTGGVALSRTQEASSSRPYYKFPGQIIVRSRAKGPRAIRDAVAGKLAAHYHTSKKCVRDSTLALLAATVKRDEELLVELGKKLDLDDSDIGYLLNADPSSEKVSGILEKISEGRQGVMGSPGGVKPKTAGRKKSIVDF